MRRISRMSKGTSPVRWRPKRAAAPIQWGDIDRLTTLSAPAKLIPANAEKMDECLYFINVVKNSVTVKTGEFEALTLLFNGQKMYVDTRDVSVAPHLMIDGHWEPEISHVFRSLIQPGDTVLDVGANFGYFGLLAGSVLDKTKGRIHFIEANPTLLPYLRKTLAVNGLSTFATVSNVGIADVEGELEFNVLEDYWGSSSFSDEMVRDASIASKRTVQTTTLDQYCSQHGLRTIDVVKLDVEGYEERAYRGMTQVVATSPGLTLLVEFTPRAYDAPAAFLAQLRADFRHVYAVVKGDVFLEPVASLEDCRRHLAGGWVMLVASQTEVTL